MTISPWKEGAQAEKDSLEERKKASIDIANLLLSRGFNTYDDVDILTRSLAGLLIASAKPGHLIAAGEIVSDTLLKHLRSYLSSSKR